MAQYLKDLYLSQEELKKLSLVYKTNGVKEVQSLLQSKLSELDSVELNIAITGESGAGKSTFVNSVRGLRDVDEGAAITGVVETTMKPTKYKHPTLPNVYFWDLPGIGTTKFPADKYLKEMQFERYDFFIIISACRFTENDTKLAKEIYRLRKKFFFVRSKIDNDLNSMEKGGKEFNEEEELEKIRNDCVSKLEKEGIESPSVFLISNFDLNLYDYDRLNQVLQESFPEIKQSVFMLSLPNINLDIIKKKNEELKKRVWMLAIISGAVPGLSFACDIAILIGALVHFQMYLGLDDASLQRLANRVRKPVKNLKAVVKTPLVGGEITVDKVSRISFRLAVVSFSILETIFYLVPVLGSIFGAGSSFLMTYKLLSAGLEDLTESAQQVVKTAFGIESIRDSFFSPGELKKLQSAYKTGALKAVKPMIWKKLDDMDNTVLNIAVMGKTESEKSNFINAVRGLQENDEEAVIVGYTEITMEPIRYKHPNIPNIYFWDLPGIRMPKFQAKKYLKEINFKRFDFFIIISANQFSENDAKLAKEIGRQKKNFYFIRAEVDNDLNSLRKGGKEIDEKEELEKIKNNCVSELLKAGISVHNAYLMSYFNLNLYDFNLFNETIEDDLPNIQKSLYRLSVPNLNSETVEKKRRELEKRIWMLAALSGEKGAVPGSGSAISCNIEVLIGGIHHFRKSLDLENASLQRLAKMAAKPVEDLRVMVTTPLAGEITPNLITELQQGHTAITISELKYSLDFIPVISSLFEEGSSFLMIYKMLNAALDNLTENAESVVKAAFGTETIRDEITQFSNSTCSSPTETLNNVCETAGLTPKKVNDLDSSECNVAVTGETGTGKSTFINTIRGLRDDDKGAAKVGNTETTMELMGYKHPNLPNVYFWDLSGVGTMKLSANEYARVMKFQKYDCFIIISDRQFTESEVKFAEEIKRLGKQIYFIRSKLDNHLVSIKKQRIQFNDKDELEKIRNVCVSKLQEAGIPSPRVFLISNLCPDLYDFNLLNKALEENLLNVKKDASSNRALLLIQNLELVEEEREVLKKQIWNLATLSGAVGTVPIPGVSLGCDIGILIGAIIHLRKCMGLDDVSLQRLANMTGKSVEDLKAVVTTPLMREITPDVIYRMRWGLTAASTSAVELAVCNIPIIGSLFGAGSSFIMTYVLLKDTLDDFAENAQRVINTAFGTESTQ